MYFRVGESAQTMFAHILTFPLGRDYTKERMKGRRVKKTREEGSNLSPVLNLDSLEHQGVHVLRTSRGSNLAAHCEGFWVISW